LRQVLEGCQPGGPLPGSEADPRFVRDDGPAAGVENAGARDGLQRPRVIPMRAERGGIPVLSFRRVWIELERSGEVAKGGGAVSLPPPGDECLIEPRVRQPWIERKGSTRRTRGLRVSDLIRHRAKFALQQIRVCETRPTRSALGVSFDQLPESLFSGDEALGRARRQLKTSRHVGFASFG